MTNEPDEATVPPEAQESLIRILLFDVMTAQERLNADQSQASMRDLVRSIFAAVEGMLWIYSKHIASIAKQVDEVTPTEEMALSQVSYHVTADGEVIEQTRYLSMPTAIRLATQIAKRINPELEARFDTSGWLHFRAAITTRNRITHPKKRSDLLITDDDVSTCLAGLFWMLELAEGAMTAANAAFANHTAGLTNVFESLQRGDAQTWAMYRDALLSDDE